MMGGPGGPREGPSDGDLGGLAQQGANVASFPRGGAVLRITDADASNWLPRALRNALGHWPTRRRNPPALQPQPPHKRRRR